jgi:subtilisin family serine protease
MRGTTISAGPAGVCGRLSQEVGRLFHWQDWWSARASKDRRFPRQRTLNVELLEVRHLMDAAGLTALVSPAWFQSVSGVEGPQHAGTATWTVQDTAASSASTATSTTSQANLYDWIVQFNTAALSGVSSVADTASLLVGGGINFQVVEGLGLTGEVLVRSSGASLNTVESWFSRDANVSDFELDAVRQFDTTTDSTDQAQAEKTSSDPQLSSLWGLTKIDATDAWNVSTGSKSVVVAVIDTGVDYTDSDLAANIWTNPNAGADGFQGDVHGYDFANNDSDPMDDNSHGTHVAGILGAVGNNSQGGVGVDWSVSIMPLKFLNSQGTGYLSDAIRAINYVTMERTQYGVNVRVINASWGGGDYGAAMQNAIQAANDAGILFVTAAGNNGTNNDATAQYPANYAVPNVISVAATDQNDKLASFSNYGATTVDIAAPGVSIYSTVPGNKYATYSGTSMAAPYVSGVAALCWAIDPDATVAEVRNALLQGVDSLASLSGKLVSGGRLDANKTLGLIEAGLPQGPTIASLTTSSSSVTAGSAVTLTAHGLAASSGNVTNVYFYQDTNNNGQYDSGDAQVASTTTIAGGVASASVNTSGLAQGTYRYFARALDNQGRWSAAASTTLAVLPGDDYGNTAATAGLIAAPGSLQGVIGAIGDVDWFQFQAQAGKVYVLSTQLGTLKDSVLCLYDRNGTTLLARDNDSGGNLASRITWTAPTSGTYYLAVAANGNVYTGSYGLSIQTQNSAPVLATIADQTMSSAQTTLSVALNATDRDGDHLTYSAQVSAVDPLAQKAYNLDQKLKLSQYGGSYSTNLLGAGEKYLRAADGTWYFLLSNGGLYRWGGTIARSTLVDTFSSAYYANPALLWNAQLGTATSLSSSNVSVSFSGNTLTIKRAAGYTGDFCVYVTVSDGLTTATSSFHVTVQTTAAMRAASIDDAAVDAITPAVTPAAQTQSVSVSAVTPDPFLVRKAASWAVSGSAREAASFGLPVFAGARIPLGVSDVAGSLDHYASSLASFPVVDATLATLAASSQTLPWQADQPSQDVRPSVFSASLSAPALDSLLAQSDADFCEPWGENW